jgi:O-antigen/teichoic acid export membrane protein
MTLQLWQKLLAVQDGQYGQVATDLHSDLGWHSLKANAAAVLGARLFVPTLNVVLIVAIARLGGAAPLGQYTLLTTLFVLCENLKSLGLTAQMVRDVARDETKAVVQYRSLVRIGLWGALVTAPLIFIVASCTNTALRSLTLPALIICVGLVPSAYALANDALFLALGRAHLTMYVTLAENLLRLALSIIAVSFWGGGIFALCAIYAASRAFAALIQEFLIRRHLRLVFRPYDRAITESMLRSAPAFATVFVVPLILFRMDVILLGIMTSDYEVGVYSAAMRLITVCLILPDGVMTATFALLSKLAGARTGNDFRHLVDRTVQCVAALMMPLTMAGALLAPVLLRILYGAKFDSAIPVMQILMWVLVPFGVNRALGDAMVARGEQGAVARIVLINLAISPVLYLILIPRLGLNGAAWSFLFSVLGCCVLSAIVATHRSRIASAFMVWVALVAAVIGSIGFAIAGSTSARTISSLAACLVVAAGVVCSWSNVPRGWWQANGEVL